MVIARIGNFALAHKTYITKKVASSYDLEIRKYYYLDDEEYCYTIAYFNEDVELVSCNERLIKDVKNQGDWEAVSTLAKIGVRIIGETDECTLEGKLVDLNGDVIE